ncbi:unnamed protein product [Zymoseptoria tritici ST99CH_1A5]|uniref:Uncharacterized protein n=1 Tax=Zymoseptoria tritici ST99CH_1A5 TaxID=1276529 RepID=A0A1Y6M4A1_ZYMTR|nr:unnamed protein product [Zymoseptoria tritici ST99CH_1A5]
MDTLKLVLASMRDVVFSMRAPETGLEIRPGAVVMSSDEGDEDDREKVFAGRADENGREEGTMLDGKMRAA